MEENKLQIHMISDEIKKQNDTLDFTRTISFDKKGLDTTNKWLTETSNGWIIKDFVIVGTSFLFEHIIGVYNLTFINCHFFGLSIVANYTKNMMNQVSDARTNIRFENCIFETNVYISGNYQDVTFDCPSSDKRKDDIRCQFKQGLIVKGKFRILELKDIEIKGGLQMQISEYGNFKILNAVFHNQCSIIYNTFHTFHFEHIKFMDGKFDIPSVLSIGNNKFEGDIMINDIEIECEKNFEIIDNTFNGNCNLENIKATTLYIDISTLGTKKRLNISNDFGKKNIRIDKLIFNRLPPKTYLENLNIGELELSRNTIEDKEILSLTNLEIRLLKIENFINYGFFTINNLNPIEKSKIEISNSTLGKLDLVSCDLSKFDVQIDNSKLVDIFYTDTKFPDEIRSNKENAKTRLEQQRDTYGQLKVVSEKVGNRFQALKFQAKEMAAYYEILEKWTLDKVTLWAMKWSNNFRQSWVRGVLFTLFIGLIPYIFLVVSLNDVEWCFCDWEKTSDVFCSYFGKYFEFLNPAHKSDFITKKEDNIGSLTYLCDFIGRIFIGFGIYQTIQAFRKFGKE